MKLYINTQLNKIVQAVYDDQVFKFDNSTLAPYYTFDIDEVDPTNKKICIDIIRTLNQVNDVGVNKYSIENGILVEEVGWVPKVEIL